MTDILEKKLHREKKARLQAEELLEQKSRELYEAQQRVERRNITLEETLDKLESAQSQLVQSEKMASLGTMAAGIAHEINNPIAFINSNCGSLTDYFKIIQKLLIDYDELIMANVDKLGDDRKVSKIQEFKDAEDIKFIISDIDVLLNESKEGLDRIRKIVAGLKEFTHLDESDLKEADINAGIESTINIVWNEIKYNCTIKKDLAKLPLISCCPGELNQVFMNLIVNASHAIKDKKGLIGVRTNISSDNFVEIHVTDNGSGISKENMAKLFNPFFTTKAVGSGTGLGLSISYGIIEKHGGEIKVKSKLDVGTCFTVRLPIKHIEEYEKNEENKENKENEKNIDSNTKSNINKTAA